MAVLSAVAQLYCSGATKGNNEGHSDEVARACMRCLHCVIDVAYQFGEDNAWGSDHDVADWINQVTQIAVELPLDRRLNAVKSPLHLLRSPRIDGERRCGGIKRCSGPL